MCCRFFGQKILYKSLNDTVVSTNQVPLLQTHLTFTKIFVTSRLRLYLTVTITMRFIFLRQVKFNKSSKDLISSIQISLIINISELLEDGPKGEDS